jgi:hypothetical protein
MDVGMILKRFDAPDEVREMPLGRLEIVRLGGPTREKRTASNGHTQSK